MYKKNCWSKNRVGSVIWLAWRGDTGNGLCAEQTLRLTVAKARETAPPPSSEDGKDACVCALSSQKPVIYLIQDAAEKSTVAFYKFILHTWIINNFWMWRAGWKKKMAFGNPESACWPVCTPGEPSRSDTYAHLSHTLGLRDDLSSCVSSTRVSISSSESERPWSCWGEMGGLGGVGCYRTRGKGAPF